MAIKTYKPTTPSRRHMTVSAFEGIDKKAKPERSLTENLKKNAGRNSYGRIPSATAAAATRRSTALSTSSGTRTAPLPSSTCSTIPTAPPTSP